MNRGSGVLVNQPRQAPLAGALRLLDQTLTLSGVAVGWIGLEHPRWPGGRRRRWDGWMDPPRSLPGRRDGDVREEYEASVFLKRRLRRWGGVV